MAGFRGAVGIFCLLLCWADAQELFLVNSHSNETSRPPATSSNICGKEAEVVSKTVSNQGKFAVWHDALEALLWVDTPAFTPAWSGSIIYAFRPKDNNTYTVMTFDTATVGAVMPRKGGGVVIAISRPQSNGMVSTFETMDIDESTLVGSTLRVLATLPSDTKGKFNNGNCDIEGRFWAGTFDFGKESELQGKVWVLEGNGGEYDAKVAIDGVAHPNGLIFSPDGSHLLFSDTFRNTVYRYTLSAGKIDGAAEELVVGTSGESLIDSMCGLTDGSFYVMNPNPIGKISYYNADGSLNCDGHVSAPTSHFMASCAFAPNAGEMYVPTGRNGGGSSGPDGQLYRFSNVHGGIAPTPCDISDPSLTFVV